MQLSMESMRKKSLNHEALAANRNGVGMKVTV